MSVVVSVEGLDEGFSEKRNAAPHRRGRTLGRELDAPPERKKPELVDELPSVQQTKIDQ